MDGGGAPTVDHGVGTVGPFVDDGARLSIPERRCPRFARGLAGGVALVIALAACSQDDDTDARLPEEPAAPADPDPPEPEPAPDEPDEPEEEPDEPEEPQEPEEDDEPDPSRLASHGVSAGHPAAVEAGIDVLDAGGTAVDAAIAAAFAVGVVEPFASGIGGGGAAVIVEPDGSAEAYDYREVVNDDGVVPATNTGTPGFVAGMEALHGDHGAVGWSDLLAPAIELADDGVPTPGIVATQLASGAGRLPVGDLPHLYPSGAPLEAGAPMEQDDLADTLRTLSDDGAEAFYEGSIAEVLTAQVEGLDAGTLASYDVQRSEPARGRFAGHELVAAAPPLPGAVMVQLLQVAESSGIEDMEPGSADYVDTLTQAWEVADRTVSEQLGDPDFVDVPVDELTDPDRNADLASTLPIGWAPPDAGRDVAATAVGNTTHITVVDGDGTVVSMTNTLTNFWGSGQYTAGFFLNDQLSRFSIGGGTNEPAPGRRSVSWSLPMVVVDDEGRPVLGIGSPGGRRIPSILSDVVTRWAAHDQELATAVEAHRFHLDAGVLQVEQVPADDVATELRARGYGFEVPTPPYYFGSVQALEIDHETGEVTGAVDPRRDGDWASAPVDP